MVFLLWPPPDHPGPWFEDIWIYIMSESFHVNLTFSSSVVHEKKIFKWPHPIFVIISPLKRNWSFIWTIQNPIYPRMICNKRDWNWPTGSGGGDFFFNINTCKYGFPYCSPSRPLTGIFLPFDLRGHWAGHIGKNSDICLNLGKSIFFQNSLLIPYFTIKLTK
jgi:hypothetical protein